MTNYDKIKAMSEQKMATLLDKVMYCAACPIHIECEQSGGDCRAKIYKWLNAEASSEKPNK